MNLTETASEFGIIVLSEEDFTLRMARAIYLNSKRRNVAIIRGWDTLTDETKAVFLAAATVVIGVLDIELEATHRSTHPRQRRNRERLPEAS